MWLRGILAPMISLSSLALSAQAPKPEKCEHIQLRFADTVYRSPDLVPPNTRVYRNSAQEPWSYPLKDTVVLDEGALVSVGVEYVRYGPQRVWSVFGRITPRGAEAFSDATAHHVGQYLGIMIGDDLVSTPIIQSRLSGTYILLRDNVTRAVADSLLTRAARAIGPDCVARTAQTGPPGSASPPTRPPAPDPATLPWKEHDPLPDCSTRRTDTVCLRFPDDYRWMVEDVVMGWDDAGEYEGRPVRVAHGKRADYYHVSGTRLQATITIPR